MKKHKDALSRIVKRKRGYFALVNGYVLFGPCKTYSSAYGKLKRIEMKVKVIKNA